MVPTVLGGLAPSLVFAFTLGYTADRYLFLPVAGLCLALAWGAVSVWEAAAGLEQGRRRALRAAVAAGTAALLLLFGTLSARQAPVWRSSLSIFAHSFPYDPGYELVAFRLADLYAEEGRFGDALAALRRSAQARGAVSRGNALVAASVCLRKGDHPAALRFLALAEGGDKREFWDVLALRGFTYRAMGEREAARRELLRSQAAKDRLVNPPLFSRDDVDLALKRIEKGL
jgi:hypothetical protein